MTENSPKKLENIFTSPKLKNVKTEKEKRKRIITTISSWNFTEEDLTYENQINLLRQIHEKKIINKNHCEVILSQIRCKLNGYRNQDMEKKKFEPELFVDEQYVLDSLIECNMKCFYCKENVNILYEYVRASKQWSFDRLDNHFGHNKNNLVVACLGCNLRRKTMHHERYVFTKQLDIKKVDS
jgi:hypothetical protein